MGFQLHPRTCVGCGGSFTGRVRKFCTDECRKRTEAQRKRDARKLAGAGTAERRRQQLAPLFDAREDQEVRKGLHKKGLLEHPWKARSESQPRDRYFGPSLPYVAMFDYGAMEEAGQLWRVTIAEPSLVWDLLQPPVEGPPLASAPAEFPCRHCGGMVNVRTLAHTCSTNKEPTKMTELLDALGRARVSLDAATEIALAYAAEHPDDREVQDAVERFLESALARSA